MCCLQCQSAMAPARVIIHKVLQAAGGSDNNVSALAQVADLDLFRGAAGGRDAGQAAAAARI